MIVFPANVLVCGELVTIKVELDDSSLIAGYDGVGLIIESLTYKMETSSSTSLSSSSSPASMYRLRSVESLSSVTLNTAAEASYLNSLPVSPNTAASNTNTASPVAISPSTSFSSVMAATMIDSIVKNTMVSAGDTPVVLQLSFRVDPEAVSESPGAMATLTLQVALTAKKGDRIERLRAFQASVPVIRALGITFLRKEGLVQLVLGSGPKAVDIKKVALKGCQLVGEQEAFMVPERSSHALVFKGSQPLLNVQVEAVIDDRPVSLSFESSSYEGDQEESQNSNIQFAFKKLPQAEDDCLLLQFQLQMKSAQVRDISVHYAQTSSIVPFSRSTRLIPVLPCGIVQWTERFKRVTQDSVKLFLSVSDSQSNSCIIQKTIIL